MTSSIRYIYLLLIEKWKTGSQWNSVKLCNIKIIFKVKREICIICSFTSLLCPQKMGSNTTEPLFSTYHHIGNMQMYGFTCPQFISFQIFKKFFNTTIDKWVLRKSFTNIYYTKLRKMPIKQTKICHFIIMY